MKVLVKTGNLTREEWLKWRTKGIGGSDVSVIAGINKFRSVFQLWLEKTGQVIPEESENKFTHFGNVLEPIVKKDFMKVTGLKVRAKKMLLLVDYTGALHIFGRTFATQMYEEGARVKDIAAYIGDLASTTEQYYIAARKKVKVGDKSKHIVELPKAKG